MTTDTDDVDPLVWLASGLVHSTPSCRSIGVPVSLVGPVPLSTALAALTVPTRCGVCWGSNGIGHPRTR
ncbi:MAG: hypothetical protein ACOH17_04375 [Cellulomonas sp.]